MKVDKVTVPCAFCGKDVTRYPSQLKGKKYIFCGRECMAKFSRKDTNPGRYLEYRDYTNNAARFSELARKNNPTKMTPEVREKLRNARLGNLQVMTKAEHTRLHARQRREAKQKEVVPDEVRTA